MPLRSTMRGDGNDINFTILIIKLNNLSYFRDEANIGFPWISCGSSTQIELEFRMLVFQGGGGGGVGEKNGEPGENPRSKDQNQQQTQPTYDAGPENRTRATLVGSERSHHCAIPAPLMLILMHLTRIKVSRCPAGIQFGIQFVILAVHFNSFCVEVYGIAEISPCAVIVTFILVRFCQCLNKTIVVSAGFN